MGHLSCPVCPHGFLADVRDLQQRIASVLSRPLSCPICSEALVGLPALHDHLGQHLPLPQEGDALAQCSSPLQTLVSNMHLPNSVPTAFTDHLVTPRPTYSPSGEDGNSLESKKLGHGEGIPSLEKLEISDDKKLIEFSPSLNVLDRNTDSPSSPKSVYMQNLSRTSSRCSYSGDEVRINRDFSLPPSVEQNSCDICGLVFSSEHFLQLHKDIIHKHSDCFEVSCKICNEKFADLESYRNHVRENHSERRYLCEECPKTFKLKGSLVVHKRMYHDGSPSTCHVCNKKFPSHTRKEFHERRFHSGSSKSIFKWKSNTHGSSSNLQELQKQSNESSDKIHSIQDAKKSLEHLIEETKSDKDAVDERRSSDNGQKSSEIRNSEIIRKLCRNTSNPNLSNLVHNFYPLFNKSYLPENEVCMPNGFNIDFKNANDSNFMLSEPKSASLSRSLNDLHHMDRQPSLTSAPEPTDPVQDHEASISSSNPSHSSFATMSNAYLSSNSSNTLTSLLAKGFTGQTQKRDHTKQEQDVNFFPPFSISVPSAVMAYRQDLGNLNYQLLPKQADGLNNSCNQNLLSERESFNDESSSSSTTRWSRGGGAGEGTTNAVSVGNTKRAVLPEANIQRDGMNQLEPNRIHRFDEDVLKSGAEVSMDTEYDNSTGTIIATDAIRTNKERTNGPTGPPAGGPAKETSHPALGEGAKQWECDVCKKTFTTKYFLKKHKRLHTGETPYCCGECGKTFTFQQSYHKHVLYHSDEKPHACSYCGRSFKEMSTLHNHVRIHTGEKPFVCETCGKAFRQRVSYLVHLRIHTGVLPYTCTACGKSFRYKVSLRSHKCDHASSISKESPGSADASPSRHDTTSGSLKFSEASSSSATAIMPVAAKSTTTPASISSSSSSRLLQSLSRDGIESCIDNVDVFQCSATPAVVSISVIATTSSTLLAVAGSVTCNASSSYPNSTLPAVVDTLGASTSNPQAKPLNSRSSAAADLQTAGRHPATVFCLPPSSVANSAIDTVSSDEIAASGDVHSSAAANISNDSNSVHQENLNACDITATSNSQGYSLAPPPPPATPIGRVTSAAVTPPREASTGTSLLLTSCESTDTHSGSCFPVLGPTNAPPRDPIESGSSDCHSTTHDVLLARGGAALHYQKIRNNCVHGDCFSDVQNNRQKSRDATCNNRMFRVVTSDTRASSIIPSMAGKDAPYFNGYAPSKAIFEPEMYEITAGPSLFRASSKTSSVGTDLTALVQQHKQQQQKTQQNQPQQHQPQQHQHLQPQQQQHQPQQQQQQQQEANVCEPMVLTLTTHDTDDDGDLDTESFFKNLFN